jgi:hypothetical protein
LPRLFIEIRANELDVSCLTLIADSKLAGDFQQCCSLRQPKPGDLYCGFQTIGHIKVFEFVCCFENVASIPTSRSRTEISGLKQKNSWFRQSF